MPDETLGQAPTGDGQEPTVLPDQTEQAGQEPATSEQDAGGQEPPAGKVYDEDYVKRLREEAASYRRKLRELEQKVKAYEEEKLSEQEKLQRRLQELEAERQRWEEERTEVLLRDATTRAALKLGLDPELAYRILSVEDVELDEDGNPANVQALLEEAVRRWPHLRRAVAEPPVSATNPERARPLTLEDIRRMTPDEINARWDEISQLLEQRR